MKNLLIALTVALLSACATVEKQSFNAQAHQNIATIGIVKPNNPEEIKINVVNHAGYQFGLIGGLVAAAELESKESSYNSAIEDQQLNLSNHLQQKLGEYLNAAGYQVVMIDAPREKAEYVTDYKTLDGQGSVDAYVDAYIKNAGFIAGSHTSNYLPTVWVQVRLVDSHSEEILYTDEIYCGYHFSGSKAVHLNNASQYQYNTFESLVGKSSETVEGLKSAQDRIAKKIADQLQRESAGLEIDKQGKL